MSAHKKSASWVIPQVGEKQCMEEERKKEETSLNTSVKGYYLCLCVIILVQAASVDAKLATYIFLVQACLCATHMVADKAKLAIVFTYFWSWCACVRHLWWRTKRSWPLFLPTFFLLFSTPSAFQPLQGNSRDLKFVSPHILA